MGLAISLSPDTHGGVASVFFAYLCVLCAFALRYGFGLRLAPGRDLDLDLHRRFDQSADQRRRRRPGPAQELSEDRRNLVEIRLVDEVVVHAHDVVEAGPGLLQGVT